MTRNERDAEWQRAYMRRRRADPEFRSREAEKQSARRLADPEHRRQQERERYAMKASDGASHEVNLKRMREYIRQRRATDPAFAEKDRRANIARRADPSIQAKRNQAQRVRYAQDATYRATKATNERANRANNPQRRIGVSLRRRLSDVLRRAGAVKHASAVRDCGCPLDVLVAHIEAQFDAWMTWENYGNKLGDWWSIDHIIPFASFNLADPAQQRAACHFTNLRPLRHSENMSKGCRL